jgi:hypothetical protein
VLAGESWSTEADPARQPYDVDVPARGWHATLEATYDLGPFELSANMSLSRIHGRYEAGTYRDIGIALTKRFRLSRWMLAWISLGIGQRTWLGVDPPERNSTTVMLSIGTTFR